MKEDYKWTSGFAVSLELDIIWGYKERQNLTSQQYFNFNSNKLFLTLNIPFFFSSGVYFKTSGINVSEAWMANKQFKQITCSSIIPTWVLLYLLFYWLFGKYNYRNTPSKNLVMFSISHNSLALSPYCFFHSRFRESWNMLWDEFFLKLGEHGFLCPNLISNYSGFLRTCTHVTTLVRKRA